MINPINSINVIMPMLGSGSRMCGIEKTCKPLMHLNNGDVFFIKALSSLKKYHIDQLILVVLDNYYNDFVKLEKDIISLCKCCNLTIIPHSSTSNPIDTVRIGIDQLCSVNNPLIVLDCDIYTEIPIIERDNNSVGCLFYFDDNIGNKSYIKIHQCAVVDIAEKELISNNAIFGAYMFFDVDKLFSYIKRQNLNYISDLYKEFLRDKLYIQCEKINDVMNFGTLEELKKCC